MRKQAPAQPLEGALELDTARRAFRFRDHALAQNLYGDCPPETLAYARPRLGWQPVAPQSTPVRFTGRSAGTPHSYIRCEADKTIPPAHQRQMSAGFAPEDIHSLPTGHSPFFAAPEALAALLDRIATG